MNAAEATIQKAIAEQRTAIAAYQNEFGQLTRELKPAVQRLTNPLQIRREIESKVAGERQVLELTEFLQRQHLRHALIMDIGPGRKATLASYGVESAADVSSQTLASIKGFGPALKARLVEWRRIQETRFRFDPHKPPSPYLKAEVEKRFQASVKALKEATAKIETRLNEAEQMCSGKLRSGHARVVQAARQRDQAKANIDSLEARLRS